jgi:hypothetical protein
VAVKHRLAGRGHHGSCPGSLPQKLIKGCAGQSVAAGLTDSAHLRRSRRRSSDPLARLAERLSQRSHDGRDVLTSSSDGQYDPSDTEETWGQGSDCGHFNREHGSSMGRAFGPCNSRNCGRLHIRVEGYTYFVEGCTYIQGLFRISATKSLSFRDLIGVAARLPRGRAALAGIGSQP